MRSAFGIVVLCLAAFIPNSFAQIEEQKTDRFYVKGTVDSMGPFAGQYMRILGNEEKATIVYHNQHGIAIVRMAISVSAPCHDIVPQICLNSIVSDTKNAGTSHTGDMLRLVIDTSGKKQSISFLTGKLAGSTVSISQDLLSEKPETLQKFIFIQEKTGKTSLTSPYADDDMVKAINKTRQFVTSSHTFAFDGIQQSLSINLVSILQSKTVPTYIAEASFDSAHPGYGDRSGQVLKDAKTHHTMRVMISDSGIDSAITDGVWDEFNQSWKK